MYIYTIRSKSNDREIYIGSTKNSVRRRQTLHKSACKQEKITPLYEHINRNGGWNNYYCELYEEFSGTLDELKKREGELIRQFKNDSSIGSFWSTEVHTMQPSEVTESKKTIRPLSTPSCCLLLLRLLHLRPPAGCQIIRKLLQRAVFG